MHLVLPRPSPLRCQVLALQVLDQSQDASPAAAIQPARAAATHNQFEGDMIGEPTCHPCVRKSRLADESWQPLTRTDSTGRAVGCPRLKPGMRVHGWSGARRPCLA